MARCAICYTVVGASEASQQCPDCKTDYHQSCWNEIGGCGTYGCKKAAVAEKPPVPVLVGQGWGDQKPCPNCNAQIGSSLLVCSCGAKFPWADPMTNKEYREWTDKQSRINTARKALIWMFILSLVGLLAPVIGPLAGVYAWFKRKDLAASGGTYLAMGYGSAAIGAVYLAIIVALKAGG